MTKSSAGMDEVSDPSGVTRRHNAWIALAVAGSVAGFSSSHYCTYSS
jgi:hypothetical protein